jgi:hypothetical protein
VRLFISLLVRPFTKKITFKSFDSDNNLLEGFNLNLLILERASVIAVGQDFLSVCLFVFTEEFLSVRLLLTLFVSPFTQKSHLKDFVAFRRQLVQRPQFEPSWLI